MSRIRQTISGLFSFETLFVLYFFAGQYKKEELFKQYINLPDLTPVLFTASVAVGMFIIIVNKLEIKRQTYSLLFLFLLFLGYTGLSLSWSNSLEYGATKTLYLGFQNFWNLLAAAIIIVPDPKRLRRLMFGLLLVSLIYAGLSLNHLRNFGGDSAISFSGTDYDGVSFIICTGLAVLTCYIIDASQNKLVRISSFALCCSYFFILLFVGHRGYLIATVLGMVALVFLTPNDPTSSKYDIGIKKSHIILLIICLVTFIAILQLLGKSPATVSRLLLLSEPSQHGSTLTRLLYYKEAFRIWSENPIFGSGIGSFPIIIGSGDMREYPHNLILEILAELGLVGLLLFGLLWFYAVKMLLKNLFTNYPLSSFVFLVFVTSLVEALFSGDISDHRLLMLSLGLMMFPQEASQVSDGFQPQASILPAVRQVALRNRY